MFGRKPKNEDLKFDRVIDKALDELLEYDSNSEEFKKNMDYLERLKALTSKDERRVSPDTVALVFGNLLGILIIVGYEHAHVVTTKALGFTLKK